MVASMLRIFALTYKELLAVLKDPRSRVVLFLPPIFQSLIFGYAATYDLNYVPYAVADFDNTATSREFLARLDGSGIFHRVAEPVRPADVDRQINTSNAVLVVRIDQDFER